MIPTLLFEIALIVIAARSAYVTFQLLNRHRKPWFDVLFHASIAVVALYFLLI